MKGSDEYTFFGGVEIFLRGVKVNTGDVLIQTAGCHYINEIYNDTIIIFL